MGFLKHFFIAMLISIFSCTSVSGTQTSLKTPPLVGTMMTIPKLDKALTRDLQCIHYPPSPWIIETNPYAQYYDVVIIGAGMAGLAVGAALFKEGIFNIKIFDQKPQGFEGPWINYARMLTLRTPKDLAGPALEIPHLTFQAWYEAQWGKKAWSGLGKIPNKIWMEYLNWYRQVMQLPIENECKLVEIIPMQDCFELEFKQAGQDLIVKARKVVLATGRSGFGGACVPAIVKDIPKEFWAHTTDKINFELLKNQNVGIIGVGASAFDAAAVSLETGAKNVDMLMRRTCLPSVNKFVELNYKGFLHGYYKLSDEQRLKFMCEAFDPGIPPPFESLDRIKTFPNFHLRANTVISQIEVDNSQLLVKTNKGEYHYDFLILATGFNIEGNKQPELRHVIGQIALWQERLPPKIDQAHPHLGRFPYLGPSFEFQSKHEGSALYLKNLYCFNYGATLSHGMLSGDIPAISIGATRLAQGIAADFFIQDNERYLERLQESQKPEFDQDHYFPES